jgi:hypothetical protein
MMEGCTRVETWNVHARPLRCFPPHGKSNARGSRDWSQAGDSGILRKILSESCSEPEKELRRRQGC